MKDKKLLFDRSCHVLYSKPCKKEMRAKIALHYPEVERETCLLYTSPSPRDRQKSRMPSSA